MRMKQESSSNDDDSSDDELVKIEAGEIEEEGGKTIGLEERMVSYNPGEPKNALLSIF